MNDFSKTRQRFYLPEDLIYLDGNSLGPLPLAARSRMQEVLQHEWGEQLIRGWNQCEWMGLSERTGDRIARLIGAPGGSVIVGDTLSLKVYQALAAALALNPDRRLVISDSGNFPTDLYMADGLLRLLDRGYRIETPAPEDVAASLSDEVAVLMLTEVDYRSGRLHDMQALTGRAHELGIITVWDLAHSAGAIEVDLAAARADFAVGCTYKYLNGGPGAPAFIYVAPELIDSVEPALSGWLGHQAPFDFERRYRAANGIRRMRIGTPPVLALAVLDAALDVWDDIDMSSVRSKSQQLSELFITEVERRAPMLRLASPRDADQRGSQVSFQFEHGYAVVQALIADNVIGDFRAPDVMRFGFAPLYVDEQDIVEAADRLDIILSEKRWDNPAYFERAAVT